VGRRQRRFAPGAGIDPADYGSLGGLRWDSDLDSEGIPLIEGSIARRRAGLEPDVLRLVARRIEPPTSRLEQPVELEAGGGFLGRHCDSSFRDDARAATNPIPAASCPRRRPPETVETSQGGTGLNSTLAGVLDQLDAADEVEKSVLRRLAA